MKKQLLYSLNLLCAFFLVSGIVFAQQSAVQQEKLKTKKILLAASPEQNPTEVLNTRTVTVVPANDLCANATTILCGDTKTGTTVGSGYDLAPDCGAGYDDPAGGVWYKYVGTGVNVTFSLCNTSTSYDTQIRAFTGSCGSFVCETGGDDECGGNGFQSEISFAGVNGVTYYILVYGYTGFINATGPFAISATCSVGIKEDNYNSSNMKVYPTPFTDGATVTIENVKDISYINIYTIEGSLVSKIEGLSGNTVEIQRNGLPAGIYFIEAGLKNGEFARKRIVIQ